MSEKQFIEALKQLSAYELIKGLLTPISVVASEPPAKPAKAGKKAKAKTDEVDLDAELGETASDELEDLDGLLGGDDDTGVEGAVEDDSELRNELKTTLNNIVKAFPKAQAEKGKKVVFAILGKYSAEKPDDVETDDLQAAIDLAKAQLKKAIEINKKK